MVQGVHGQKMIPKFIMHLLWIVPTVLLIGLSLTLFFLDTPEKPAEPFIPEPYWTYYSKFITPNSTSVTRTSSNILGIHADGNLTTADALLTQDWVSRNILLRGMEAYLPDQVLLSMRANEISIHSLTMSLFLAEQPDANVFFLVGQVEYDTNESGCPECIHLALLTVFPGRVLLTDLTVNTVDLACVPTHPNSTLSIFTQNSQYASFQVYAALSFTGHHVFASNEEFVSWMTTLI